MMSERDTGTDDFDLVGQCCPSGIAFDPSHVAGQCRGSVDRRWAVMVPHYTIQPSICVFIFKPGRVFFFFFLMTKGNRLVSLLWLVGPWRVSLQGQRGAHPSGPHSQIAATFFDLTGSRHRWWRCGQLCNQDAVSERLNWKSHQTPLPTLPYISTYSSGLLIKG